MHFASPTWAKSLTKFNPQIQDFKRVLVWSVSKGKSHQFDFFNWLSILQILVILNGSKNVRNVIQMALKELFFPNKNFQRPPQTPVWDTFRLNLFTPLVSQLRQLWKLTFDSSPFFRKTQVTCQPRHRSFCSSILRYLCPVKSPSFRKTLMLLLRVICGLACFPNQKFWLLLCTSSMFFC